MTRIILTVFSLLGSVLPVGAQQQPSQRVFEQSSRDLIFTIPAGFQPVSEGRRYLRPETHEVPRFQRMWAHGSDGIIISIIVIPDAAWQTKSSKQLFADGLIAMLSDPTLKKASERTYELDGVPAVSIDCFYDRPDGTSQRLDCFLSKPNMFMVAYLSSKPSSWDEPASKAFFQTVKLKPRAQQP